MANPVLSLVAQATTSSGWVDAPLSSAKVESDAARFSNLLQAAATSPTDRVATEATSITASATEATGRVSLGDSVLRTLSNASEAYALKRDKINALTESPEGQLTIPNMLRVQAYMTESAVQVEMLSKVASMCVRHVDALTKLQ